MDELIEPHEPLQDCDCRACAIAERDALRRVLLKCARQAEDLKQECGPDPESWQAKRNAEYQAISTTAHIALGTIRGPKNV